MIKDALETYVKGMMLCDSEMVASVFTEDCIWDDAAAWTIDGWVMPPFIRGRKALKEYLDDRHFADPAKHGTLKLEIVKIMGNVMFYDVTDCGTLIKAVGVAEMKDGLIHRYTIRQRIDEEE